MFPLYMYCHLHQPEMLKNTPFIRFAGNPLIHTFCWQYKKIFIRKFQFRTMHTAYFPLYINVSRHFDRWNALNAFHYWHFVRLENARNLLSHIRLNSKAKYTTNIFIFIFTFTLTLCVFVHVTTWIQPTNWKEHMLDVSVTCAIYERYIRIIIFIYYISVHKNWMLILNIHACGVRYTLFFNLIAKQMALWISSICLLFYMWFMHNEIPYIPYAVFVVEHRFNVRYIYIYCHVCHEYRVFSVSHFFYLFISLCQFVFCFSCIALIQRLAMFHYSLKPCQQITVVLACLFGFLCVLNCGNWKIKTNFSSHHQISYYSLSSYFFCCFIFFSLAPSPWMNKFSTVTHLFP